MFVSNRAGMAEALMLAAELEDAAQAELEISDDLFVGGDELLGDLEDYDSTGDDSDYIDEEGDACVDVESDGSDAE